jgi:hypothetical protein
VPLPPSAPLRRLTSFEYNNTVLHLAKVADTALTFPAEELGNGFGNDTAVQTVGDVLATKYITTAEKVAKELTSEARIAELAPCAVAPAADEAGCARSVIESFTPKAFRRALQPGEADGLLTLFTTLRAGEGETFATSLAGVLEAILESPEFLYRPEFGTPVAGRPDLLKPTGEEMAARLSYFFWGSMPDDALRAAASAGELDTPEGVNQHAQRLLQHENARHVFSYFFDKLLPIQGLAALERSEETYPTFSQRIGALMRLETQTFLANEIVGGTGTWPGVFTANYTYANAELAAFYGMPGVSGEQFQRVGLEGTRRLGLLTQGGIVAGPVHGNYTNPVLRGAFIVNKLMCLNVPLPSPEITAMIKEPDPYSGATARDRYSLHSTQAACAGCHANLDPVGFALENYDSVGLWRDSENNVPLDLSGSIDALGAFNGPIELAQKVAASPDTQTCFATHWMSFAYARKLSDADRCSVEHVQKGFEASGYNLQQLLLELTQTDNFLYLPAVRQ